jgi:adenylate kinase
MLRREFGFHIVASGVLLRQQVAGRTDIGVAAARFMERGALVPESLVCAVVLAEIEGCDGAPLVVEGFPKTAAQAGILDDALCAADRRTDLALALHADPQTLRARLSRRAREEGRTDDAPATVDARLKAFGTVPADLLTHYRTRGVLRVVDADRPLVAVTSDVRRLVTALGVDALPSRNTADGPASRY